MKREEARIALIGIRNIDRLTVASRNAVNRMRRLQMNDSLNKSQQRELAMVAGELRNLPQSPEGTV